MTGQRSEHLAFGLFVYTLAVFAVLIGISIATSGAGAQETHEVFTPRALYSENLRIAGGTLRIVLMLDLFFMIGYGGALGLTLYANAARNPLMAWLAGIGVGALVLLDMVENLTLLHALDLVENGFEITLAQVTAQVAISGLKWFVSALAVVALTFVLPQDTVLERLLVWAARLCLPLGTGLFVTGAFGVRELGGLLILAGMAGGFGLLALTQWLRRTRPD